MSKVCDFPVRLPNGIHLFACVSSDLGVRAHVIGLLKLAGILQGEHFAFREQDNQHNLFSLNREPASPSFTWAPFAVREAPPEAGGWGPGEGQPELVLARVTLHQAL